MMVGNPTFLDTFAGCGGFRLAFENESYECVGTIEKDKFAIKQYEHYFNDVVKWKDIRDVEPEELPDFDVMTGGIPCQPFSVAGKREGMEDDRGKELWQAFFDIAEHKRPQKILIENVRGLLSSREGLDFAWILVEMANLGYCAEWQVLNSKDFGVPQNRERVFLVGHLDGEPRRKVFPIQEDDKVYYETPKGTSGEGQQLRSQVAGAIDKNYHKGRGTRTHTVVNDQENSTAIRTNYSNGNAWLCYLSQSNANMKQRVQEREVSWTLNSGGDWGVMSNVGIRRLTPLECFRLQGFPEDFVEKAREVGISDTQLYKRAGNAVTVQVVQTIAKKIMDDGGDDDKT